MKDFFLAIAIALGVLILFSLYRAVFGPTIFDRIIGGGFAGTKTILILVLMGFIYGRIDMFVDLALAYSMLIFTGTLLFSKYFLRKGAK